jgi:dTDP-4-dehydrorhamnose 3,5-epimerase
VHVLYKCSRPYAPAREHGLHPLDPALGIGWRADIKPVLSAKDAAAPMLAEALQSGLLPQYADCITYAASLADSDQQCAG